ncbi:MAG TPA: glycosyltransferase [Acetobacteraceae bacterium]|nr:glycosyltransferase [Acetobacteraceae bacterium]
MPPRSAELAEDHIRLLFDRDFYLARYNDIAALELEPLKHYILYGLHEGRDPNPFFDGAWYREQNPDVAASGIHPLLHYLRVGGAELRNPHPRFDAAFYVEQHPEAALNPLLFHMLLGRARGFATEPPFDAALFLPSQRKPYAPPRDLVVDVVVPCYRGLEETRRCLASVLADPDRPRGRVLVIDDASPEPALAAYLDALAAAGRVVLLRNQRNLGFVASANRGIAAAGCADVALLNSDAEVPRGWLRRLAGHAYAAPRIASVSPWSNNATICSYPGIGGGEPAFGLGVGAIDRAAQEANAGRQVPVPVTVGFCMYIRRDALDEVGSFDEAAFGRGYGEECDFCLRAAARGWQHVLACDTYVYHAAETSFGASAAALRAKAEALLATRWPDYRAHVHRHMLRGTVEPFRFALTAALYRRAGLPVILHVTHALAGGVERHLDELARSLRGHANLLSLRPSGRGALIGAPTLPGHGAASIPAERTDAIAAALASAGVARAHVHHVMSADFDLRALIRALAVPFDLTIHDYFLICPQVNLLPRLDGQYCGEPEQAACNACIAERPNHGAREILEWRTRHDWLLRDAERVLCPSEDARARIARYGAGARAVLAPHEPAAGGRWPVRRRALKRGERLRIALLGVLAAQKGLPTVAAFARVADPARFELVLIGYPEYRLPAELRKRIKILGPYQDADLRQLLAKAAPHVVWFPAQWPETWSYTLSAALDAGLPLVASRIGAFPERVAGRTLTWLVDPDAPAASWIAAFEAVRAALGARAAPSEARRPAVPSFYPDAYLAPLGKSGARSKPPARLAARPRVIVVPERFAATGMPTPCAYIRLLQPLSHPGIGADLRVARADEAMHMGADLLITHRHAIGDVKQAEALIAHCRRAGIRLVYDLDDDLLHLPADHADHALLRGRAGTVRRLLRGADVVWASTPALAERLKPGGNAALVVPNALDERLWFPSRTRMQAVRQGPVRLLLMGTSTHDADLALVEAAVERVLRRHPGRMTVDVIGMTARADLPRWLKRMSPPGAAAYSYPGFVNWIIAAGPWDVGLAPLADTSFNRAKSALKALDYAALGLAVLASDVEPYRGSIADGPGGILVPHDPAAWEEAIERLVRLGRTRRNLAAGGRAAVVAEHTLAARAPLWQAALRAALIRENGAARTARGRTVARALHATR